MGHYASEMMCSKCGQTHCVCPTPIDTTVNKWLVDRTDFTVMKVCEFDQKYAYVKGNNGMVFPGAPRLLRFGFKLFNTKQEALAHRVVVIDDEIGYKHTKIEQLELSIEELLQKREDIENE